MAYTDFSKYAPVLPDFDPAEYGYDPSVVAAEEDSVAPEDRNSGIFGDTVDALQRGLYQGVGGIASFVQADGVADWAQGKADEQLTTMSDAGRNAMSQSLYTSEDGFNTDALTSLDFWLLNVANQVGQFGATAPLGLGAGRVIGALGNATRAGKAAGAAVDKATKGVVNSKTSGVALAGGSSAAGMAGQEAAAEAAGVIDNAPLGQLLESDMFLKARDEIAKYNPDMSDEDKLFAAKELLKEQIKDTVMYDPKVVATSMGGAFLGDNVLLGLYAKNLASKIAASRVGNAAVGAAAEGVTEAVQAGTAKRSTNEQLQPFDGRSLTAGVAEAAINEGILGGVMGGGLGAMAKPNRERAQRTADNLRANGSDALADKIMADAEAADQRQAERESFIKADDLDQPTYARNNGARTAQDVGYLGDMLIGTEAQDAIARQQNLVLDPTVDTSPTELDRFLPVPSAGRLEVEPGQTAIPDMRDRGGPVQRRTLEGELVDDDTPRRSRVEGLLPGNTIDGEIIRPEMPEAQRRIGKSDTIFAGDGRPRQRFDEEVAAAARNQVPQIEQKDIIFAGDETGVNVRSNGQPFSSERAALTSSAALAAKKAGQEIEAVPFADGFGWRIVDGTATNQQRSAAPTTSPEPSREEIGNRATPEQEQAPAAPEAGAVDAAQDNTEQDATILRGLSNLLTAVTGSDTSKRKRALDDLAAVLKQPKQKAGEDIQATAARLGAAIDLAAKLRGMTPEQIDTLYPTANDLKQAVLVTGRTPRGSKAVMRDGLIWWANSTFHNSEVVRGSRRASSAVKKLVADEADIPLDLADKAKPVASDIAKGEVSFYQSYDYAVAKALRLDRVPEPRGRGLTADQNQTFQAMDRLVKNRDEVFNNDVMPEDLQKAIAANADIAPGRSEDTMFSNGVTPELMQQLGFPKNSPSALYGLVSREIRRYARGNTPQVSRSKDDAPGGVIQGDEAARLDKLTADLTSRLNRLTDAELGSLAARMGVRVRRGQDIKAEILKQHPDDIRGDLDALMPDGSAKRVSHPVGATGAQTVTIELDKPLKDYTRDEFEAVLLQKGFKPGRASSNSSFHAARVKGIKAAAANGVTIPDKVLAEFPSLVRPDLSDNQLDIMADDLRNLRGEALTKAMREWSEIDKPDTPSNTSQSETEQTEKTENDPDIYDEIETRPDTSEKQREQGRSAVRDLFRWFESFAKRNGFTTGKDGGAPKLLAAKLLENFKAGKPNSLIGAQINGPADLAALAQVYRDPRFETFRLIFTDASGKVVLEQSGSSRLPAAVSFNADWLPKALTAADRAGATRMYMLHNHPSGKSQPSQADIDVTVKTTAYLRSYKPVGYFGGHVVIDFNEFSFIDRQGRVDTTVDESLKAIDFTESDPELFADSLLKTQIEGPETVAMLAKLLTNADSTAPTVIMTDNQGRVGTIATVPMSILKSYLGKGVRLKKKVQARAFMRRLSAASGSGGMFFVVLPPSAPKGDYQWLGDFAMDVVYSDGTVAIQYTGYKSMGSSFSERYKGGKAIGPRTATLKEDAPKYGDFQFDTDVEEAVPTYGSAKDDTPMFTNRDREVEAIINAENEKAVSKAREFLSKADAGETAKKGMFKLLTLRQFVELADKLFGGKAASPLRKYQDGVNAMMKARETASITIGKIAGELRNWATKNKVEADKLFDLMHDATLAQIDPDPDVARSPAKVTGDLLKQLDKAEKLLKEARFLEADPITISALEARIEQINGAIKDMDDNAEAEFNELRQRFDAMPAEAKEFYRQMRQVHRDNNALYHKLMQERIEKADMNPDRKKVMMAQIRLEQEFGQILGPYFPLGRFGDYVVEFTKNGERMVYAFESKGEAQSAADRLRKAGDEISDVKVTARVERDFKRDGASFLFMNDLFAEIQEKQANGEITAGDASAVTEMIYALYLKHLPERSMRKNRIKRKGVGGFSNDALRSFADVTMKNAYQLSRLEYFDVLNGAIKETEDATKAAAETKGDNVAEVAVFNELRRRHEWVMNPQNAKWARSLNALGFVYMLGVSPIAAVLNIVQSFNVGIPVIMSMAKRGRGLTVAKDMVSLMGKFLKASAAGSKWNDWQVGFDENRDDGILTAQERDVIRRLRQTGVLTQSSTHNALAIAELGAQDENFSDFTNKSLEVVGKLFHSAEVMNREITALAAYRALRKSGLSHDAAIEQAGEAVWESHFDYTNVNRAPFMQSDIAKVLFQFKQYSQQMTYYLIRNGLLSIKGTAKTLAKKGMTPEERAEFKTALTRLGGTLASTAVIGGTAALPTLGMYQLVKVIAEAVLGEEDEPYDLELEMRGWLTETVGKDAADLIVYGVTGAGFSQRVSMANLWMNEPYREPQNGEGWWTHIAKQVAGPTLGGLATNFLSGATMWSEGEFYRGTEKMLPKFARDYMVAYRYAEEGATSLRGDVLKSAEDFSAIELLLQSQGLADADVVELYSYNSAITGATDKLRRRRKQIMDKFYIAVSTGDEELRVEAIQDLRQFNSNVRDKYPAATINQKQLIQSIRSRANRSENTLEGLYTDELTAQVLDQMGYRN